AHWYASNRCAAPVSPPSRSGTHAAEGARSPADARRSRGSSLPPADHFAVEVRRAGRGEEDGEGHGAEERLHRSAAGRQLRIEALRPVVREAVPLPGPQEEDQGGLVVLVPVHDYAIQGRERLDVGGM